MAKIHFFPLDITYREVGGRAVVYMYGRTDKGEQICVKDSSFDPYFLVLPEQGAAEQLKQVKVEKGGSSYHVTRVEPTKKKLLGEEVDCLKVFVNLPRGVPHIREEVKTWKAYEFDIPFTRRYLVDKGITPFMLLEVEGDDAAERSKVPVIEAKSIAPAEERTLSNPEVLAIDIETYMTEKRIDSEKNPILMIALYSKNYRKVLTWKKFPTDEDYIEFVDSEPALLEAFKKEIGKRKPDIITGYFTDGFDFPYIIARAKKYRIKLDLGLDYSEIVMKGREQPKTSITGIVHIDILKFIRRVMGPTMRTDSYSLNAVAGELLGEAKDEVDIDRLSQVWDEGGKGIEVYCRYNLQDTKLTYDLLMKLLPNIVEMVKIVGIPPFDLIGLGFSQLVEWYIIKQTPEAGEIILNKPGNDEVRNRRRKTLKGAFVYEPKPGLYKGLVVFDFRSLYPTIIHAHNLSPSAVRMKPSDGTEKIPDQNIWFDQKKKGFISKLIGELITRRMRIKEMIRKDDSMLTAREQGLKLLANAFYGYLGFFNARWYCFECATGTTAWGRHYIQDVIKKAEDDGFRVLYSDTDSVFLLLEGKSTETAGEFVDSINKELPGIMELEYEGFYPSGIFVSEKMGTHGAKKRYALLDDKGQMKIKGFETVRRNISPIARNIQKAVLRIVLEEHDAEKAMRHITKVIQDLKEHKVDIEDVTITTQLQKEIEEYEAIGPHVKAAMRMRQKGMQVGAGTRIQYVVTRGDGTIGERARLPDEVAKSDYDSDYYINNQVIPTVESIMAVLGYDKAMLSGKEDQKKLDKFFS